MQRRPVRDRLHLLDLRGPPLPQPLGHGGQGGGRVELVWSQDGNGVQLVWTETGGGCEADVPSSGFGQRMIAMSVKSDLEGSIDREWRQEGLRAVIRFPLKP